MMKRLGRIARACSVAAVGLIAVAAPLVVRAAEAHVLRWADGLDVSTLNPLFATSANIQWLSALTMAHFVRFGPHNELIPELISEIPTTRNHGISADGRTITYHLRHGVRWSDGAPFDSADVVYTVGAIENPRNNITQRVDWDHVAGVRAAGPYTVIFTLKAPFAPFASRFFSTFSTACVLPKHLLGALPTLNEAPYNALPIGIGPFRYTAFRRGDVVEMEANPYYFRGLPKLRRVVYKIITDGNTIFTQLQTGELDLWATVSGGFADRVRHTNGVGVVAARSPYMSGIYFNNRHTVVRDAAVRRALRLATDRAYLLHTVYHDTGTLAESVVPSVAIDFDARLPQAPYDPAAAERLLDAAGWRRGADTMRAKNGVPLVIGIALPSGYAASASTAELLRAQWGKIGVGVEVKAYGTGQFFGDATSGVLPSGNFDAALLSLPGEVYADVAPTFGCAYAPPHGFNETRYCRPAIDAEMSAYIATYDPVRRAVIAARIQTQIDRDSPGIILYERGFTYAFRTTVHGFTPNSFAPFDSLAEVDVSDR
jgi:peptide/nickel transport system substrate-binding protein